MRNVFLMLLVGSVIIGGIRAPAASSSDSSGMLVAATQNFEPARSNTEVGEQPPAPQPQTPAKKPAPAAANPTLAAAAPATPASSGAAEQAARDEITRREQLQSGARVMIDEGLKLYYDGKYELAVAKLEEAVKILPRAKATEIDYNRAANALTDSYYRLADTAYRAGDNAKARQLAQKSLQYDPRNRSAENIIVKIKQAEAEARERALHPPQPPEPPRPDTMPGFVANKDQIRKLFREGKLLMNSGQFDEAEKRFKQVLLIDKYNNDALLMLDQVNVARQENAEIGQESNRRQRMWEVSDTWLPPIGGEVKLPQEGEAQGPRGPSVRAAEILQKLNDIVFPEINFREANISDVVAFLGDESRKLDSQKVGVNIVLGAGVAGSAPAAPAAPAAEGGTPAPAPVAESTGGGRPITLSLRNVPMIDALRYITQLAGLKFLVQANAILIVPEGYSDQQMITRSYPVSPGAFRTLITGPATIQVQGQQEYRALGGTAPTTSQTTDIKQLFTEAGVQFPTGSSLVYNDRTSTIVIRNTPENLEIFERVLATFDVIPSQVEIEAKFVEISQSDLDELGFNWKVGNHNSGDLKVEGGSPPANFETGVPDINNSDQITGGLRDSTVLQADAISSLLAAEGFGAIGSSPNSVATIRGILTNPQFELVIKALSQKKSTDLLSAPKVTTVSGQQAVMRVVQEFIYPTEYSEPQAGQTVITPSIPSSFRTREIGVLLNVTPSVGADKYTINLTLIPEVSEFLGFIDYSPGSVTQLGTNNVVTTVPFRILQPLFSTRSLQTSIVIWDGQTVVLGGLIREDMQKIDDKIPFLGDIPLFGRLFRSKTTVRNKRNLLIFVSARLIDPAGNPIHRSANQTASLP